MKKVDSDGQVGAMLLEGTDGDEDDGLVSVEGVQLFPVELFHFEDHGNPSAVPVGVPQEPHRLMRSRSRLALLSIIAKYTLGFKFHAIVL